MHLVCLQENFKQALSLAAHIVGKNLTLPILNNLLLTTEKNKLKISSTNLEIGINYWVPGRIEREGGITVPARLIGDFVSNLPNQNITLKAKNDQLNLKCDKFRASIKGMSTEDFPIIPKLKDKPLMKTSSRVLKDALAQVVSMTALSDTRPGISGVYVNFASQANLLAATDSFRLAEKKMKLDEANKGLKSQSVIIPQRTVQELIRIIGDREDQDQEVKIVLSENQILFDMGCVQLISRLIEDQYPDYQQIIPKSSKTQVVVDRNLLINNIRIASFFCGKVGDIKMTVDPQKNIVEIKSQNTDVGEHKSRLEAEIQGDKLETVFNYHYLLDGLNNIYSDKVIIGFNDNIKPVLLRPVGDTSYTYVVCPIRE